MYSGENHVFGAGLNPGSKSSDYKERQVNEKYCKVFLRTAHVVFRTAAMFLASALNIRSHPQEILKMATNTRGNTSVKALANNMAPMTNIELAYPSQNAKKLPLIPGGNIFAWGTG